jgi:hypothetical protein
MAVQVQLLWESLKVGFKEKEARPKPGLMPKLAEVEWSRASLPSFSKEGRLKINVNTCSLRLSPTKKLRA